MEPGREAPTPQSTGEEVLRLDLSEDGFRRLADRLDASFELHQGEPAVAGRGRNPGSWFFHSRELSDFRFMCNNWIAELLGAAGVPVNQVLATLTRGLAFDLQRRAGAHALPGRPGEERDLGRETPPAHSGSFLPASRPAEQVTGTVTFESFVVRFAQAPDYATTPFALVEAGSTEAGPGMSFSELLDVPPDSLVAVRRVVRRLEEGGGLCGDRPATHMAIGFRVADERYEIALAPWSASSDGPVPPHGAFCGVYHYVQP